MTQAARSAAPAARVAPAPGVEHSVRFLDGPSGALFCSVHAPAGGALATLVVCPPFLADHPFSYRRELLMALELARRDVAVWRFHYAGTGYSEGPPAAVAFETMVRDAKHVIDAAAAACAGPLTVAGTRGGAMVAAAAGGERPLILWEPVVDGSAYVHEGFRARMIADGGQLKRTPPTAEELMAELRRTGRIDLLGYSLHESLHDSLAGRRLYDLLARGSGPVLLIENGPTEVAERLRHLGREVTTASAGVAEGWWFMRTHQTDHAGVAAQLAGAIDPWLPRSGPVEVLSPPSCAGAPEPAYIRTRAGSVFALLTPPAGTPRGETALLLWGGGGMPAFGRNQVATALVRRLAGRGYHVLQLDYPGRGDSPGAEPPDPIDEPAKQEVFDAARAAYGWLRERGLGRVITIGSCQGAVAALNTVEAAGEPAALALLAPPIGERFEVENSNGESCGAVSTLHPRMRESFETFARSGMPLLIAYGVHDEGYQSFKAAMEGELGELLRPAAGSLTLRLTEERIHGYMTVSGQEAAGDIVMDWLGGFGS